MSAAYATCVLIRYCSLLLHISVPLNHHRAMSIQFYEYNFRKIAHIIFLQFIVLIHNMLRCYSTYSHPQKCSHRDYDN
jgi:hypothetical protein